MRITRTLALLGALLFGSAACSAVDNLLPPFLHAPSVEVVGEWLLTSRAGEGAHTESRMKFGEDGSFSTEYLWIGFYGRPADEVTGYMRTQGSYRLNGDKLYVSTTRVEQWQKYAVGENPAITTPTPAWDERGTLARDGDRLIHTYVSAPADAPQTFTEVYRRER